ncbi:MFS general substrate transporter-like protein [Parachaetomium inaequale]|uniref:MFS general substrate transporter-like protein n=1 Tax=Parachaetomium inaequale TaxID=2588326 RepID=A0AAN6SLW9_9PEZI|nr:MFS general substrate transporter-like protein [Parachaetomium inaequale]
MDNKTANAPQDSDSTSTKELQRIEHDGAKINHIVGDHPVGPVTLADSAADPAPSDTPPTTAFKPSLRFWTIFLAVGFSGLLTALEATITSTALPSIIADLQGGDTYIWAVNGYLLAMTSLQPLYGQLANIFGRRWPTITATAAFVLGSGIAGGATSMTMLIVGRVIQGVGAGGINVLCEILVCDLVPLRERGKYLAGMFGLIAVGTALGPFFGGLIVDNTTWRWVFYLNLPIGGVALVLLVLFLQVNHVKEKSLASSLGKVDWLGNVIFVVSISAMLIPLAWAGAVYSWSSFHVLVPLLVGLAGLAGFLVYEGSRFCAQPTMPLHLFSNRTSATAFALTFLHSVATLWVLYFLPVYFQGVLGSSAKDAGVQLLPTILILVPFAAVGGGIMSKLGRYRPLHHVGFALLTVGMGLLALLDENSNTGSWVGFQVVSSAGAGIIIPTLLPAVLAPLTESDTALATATWAFLRSFGQVWGTAIAAAVFNNRFDQVSGRITDEAVREQVGSGQAYQYVTAAFLGPLSPETREQFVSALNDSLRRSWHVAIAFAALGFILVILEKEIAFRNELDTEYGVAEKKTTGVVEKSGVNTTKS